jgi:integrative and conjugative element protein (TIGR02256 family)
VVNDRPKPTQLRHLQSTMIRISPRALAVITAETAARFGPEETGGILLGHDLGHQILVTAAGDPGPGATHTPTRFRRDLAYAGKLADAAYEHDHSVWVGDWHTHPRGPTRPSRYDLRTYRRFLQDPELDFDRFLALIVTPARPSNAPSLTAWLVSLLNRRWPSSPSATSAPITQDPDEADGS